jgi:signal transduction histidine kinase
MSSLNDWLYLGVGIAVGIGFCKLFLQSSKSTSSAAEKAPQTTEREILAELQKNQLAYEMAREMSRFQAGFLARTTHELRSPINGLLGLHQLILNDLCENPEEEREFVAQAYERSLKLLKMIDEILGIARTEHGTNKLELQPIRLTNILQEVHQLTYILAANRNYPFHVSFPDTEITILADYRWMRQVLLNLVDTTILKMTEGSIYLSANIEPTTNSAQISLDVPSETVIFSESIDLITSEDETNHENPQLSSGMKLLLNQKLLAVMGGKLEVVSSPITQEVTQDLTRLQISIPLATSEVALPQ